MKSRKPVEFSESFNKRLLGYAAAGMGMLATVPAKADIIYTPAHTTIKPNTSPALDLNHDGIADFQLTNFYEHHCVGGEVPCTSFFTIEAMLVQGAKAGNGALSTVYYYKFAAARLARGSRIGPGTKSFYAMTLGRIASSPWAIFNTGPWAGGGTGYLGLRFQIGGQTHHGWAALTVSLNFPAPYDEVLTGYAYDTVAGQSILAGQTSATPEPATLGLLALGSLGLGFWRRRKAGNSRRRA